MEVVVVKKSSTGQGKAKFRCNECGKVVTRNLGWKLWTPSFCESTGQNARLYRISAPTQNKGKTP